MDLNKLFRSHLDTQFSLLDGKKILLAVSGGVDSMAMLHLFSDHQLNIGVAHCNFQLRNNDSDLDNELVKTYCKAHKIPFFDIRFDTKNEAILHKTGTQETARNLRYKWFQEICTLHQFDFIATAHHRDDSIETILLNLVRGTGIDGMTGIPKTTSNIIRPLLFATKQQILHYVHEHNIPFRQDASNNVNDYSRNKIRNKIIPLLTEVNTQASTHIYEFGEYSKFIQEVLNEKIASIKSRAITIKKQEILINLQEIQSSNFARFILFELVKEFGLNTFQCDDILRAFALKKSGKSFYSQSNRATLHQGFLIIGQTTNTVSEQVTIIDIHQPDFTIDQFTYALSLQEKANITNFEKGSLYLDVKKLQLPLVIRKWENGDSFTPLGNKGKMNVSDFLINKKVGIHQKSSVFVILANDKIVCVLNHQIDDYYKIDDNTNDVLCINYIKKEG